MPFKSKAQARAAFGGYLGPVMKAKAAQWEDETPGGIKALPSHVKTKARGFDVSRARASVYGALGSRRTGRRGGR